MHSQVYPFPTKNAKGEYIIPEFLAKFELRCSYDGRFMTPEAHMNMLWNNFVDQYNVNPNSVTISICIQTLINREFVIREHISSLKSIEEWQIAHGSYIPLGLLDRFTQKYPHNY